ncbi:MAG: 4a-hydroxytetrahydrobiopterin dehydratase [Hyphomicrobiales bacterium]|nr:4a-hydroxytetrahydrobiopterin dehydratase [Hyphomicrobiales bacterium]PCH49844.1 MAG: 4a-hydroxytetrahydrobiopterin dehydratase [Hyphomicrobiales bacterium]
MTDLKSISCAACEGLEDALTEKEIQLLKVQLNEEWIIAFNKLSLSRKFNFKGFAKAAFTANLAAFISDKEGHHADIAFGWGYCHVTFTSHELGGLSKNDFICAAKIDLAMQ